MLLLSSGFCWAADKTPYGFAVMANAYSGSVNYNITWLAERYDVVLNYGDWPQLADSMMDTIQSWGTPKPFLFGPYASTQELNLYSADNTDTKADRDTMLSTVWLYIYAEHYMDSVGADPESLVVHIADDNVNIGLLDGTRNNDYTGLGYSKKRYAYQYWNNTATDTFCYPAGYTWLANGYNDTTKAAIAYAFRRYFIEDSANYGSGKYHYNAYYADNQYRNTTAPRLPSYSTIYSTTGGPTTGLDWIEQPAIQNTNDSLLKYYDNSTLLIDSAVDAEIYSYCDANSLDSVIRFANVDKYNSSHLGKQIKYTSVHFELIFPYSGDGWNHWKHMLDNADTLRDRNSETGANKRYAIWECRLDAFVNEGSWNTSDRLYYGVYSWFLTIQSSNQFLYPARFNDITRWRDIFEVDLGDAIDVTRDTTLLDGSCNVYGYGDCLYLWSCKYLNGTDTSIALYISGRGSETGQTTDSFLVSLGNNYYQIDVDADTAVSSVSSVYMFPCQGWIGTQSQALAGTPDAGTVYQGIDLQGVDLQ